MIYSSMCYHNIPGKTATDLSLPERDITLPKYSAEHKFMSHMVSASHICTDKTSWGKWTELTSWVSVRSNFSNIRYLVPILQIFAHRVRAGLLTSSRHHIWK